MIHEIEIQVVVGIPDGAVPDGGIVWIPDMVETWFPDVVVPDKVVAWVPDVVVGAPGIGVVDWV